MKRRRVYRHAANLSLCLTALSAGAVGFADAPTPSQWSFLGLTAGLTAVGTMLNDFAAQKKSVNFSQIAYLND
jgi:hypothetical protein